MIRIKCGTFSKGNTLKRFCYLDFEVSQSEGSTKQRTEMCYRWYLPPISDLCNPEKYDKYNISTFQNHLEWLLKQHRKSIYKAVQHYLPCHPRQMADSVQWRHKMKPATSGLFPFEPRPQKSGARDWISGPVYMKCLKIWTVTWNFFPNVLNSPFILLFIDSVYMYIF